MYTVNQPQKPERPKTGRGRRRMEIPPRPDSRRGGESHHRPDGDEESSGRPISRVGFSPDQTYRYSHDEFSRQVSSDNEKQILNSPCSSPEILYQDEQYFANQKAHTTNQVERYSAEEAAHVDRLILSPSSPQDGTRSSPRKHRKSPQGYRQSPKGYRQSPQGYRNSPYGPGSSPQYDSHPKRPSSREYLSVSPLQRDEAQIGEQDLHHGFRQHMTEDPYAHEGDSYQQRFSKSPHYRNSPFRESPQVASYRDSPQYRESPHYRESPSYTRESPYYNASPNHGSYGGYSGSPDSRPPPVPRPKSSRPKTGRKKSARVRHQPRYEDQETSPPQQCDTTSILNSGDPYGRPSSSLSPYKPLPAIGVATPRSPEKTEKEHKGQSSPQESASRKIENVTIETKRLMLEESAQFHPVDENCDIFSVEDIQGASSGNMGNFTGQGIPSVDMLTNLPQYLSDEIYKSSVLNLEKHMSGVEETNENDESNQDMGENNLNTNENYIDHDTGHVKPLDFLHEIPDEPKEGEARLLLAIKLPDGKRIQRYFNPQDKLETVMHFAENTNLVNYEDYQIVCNAPRTTFVDLNKSITESELKDRTVLYLEERD